MKSNINNTKPMLTRGSLNKLSSSNTSTSCYRQKLSIYKRENRQKAPRELFCVPIVDSGSESFDVSICPKIESAAI